MAAAQRWGPSAEPAAWVGFTASTVSPATQDRLGAMACGLTGGRAPRRVRDHRGNSGPTASSRACEPSQVPDSPQTAVL